MLQFFNHCSPNLDPALKKKENESRNDLISLQSSMFFFSMFDDQNYWEKKMLEIFLLFYIFGKLMLNKKS